MSVWTYNGLNYPWRSVEVELTPGVIDRNASLVFRRGHCHSLAVALHQLTGWELVSASSSWLMDWGPRHVAVRRYAQCLDVDGLSTTSELLSSEDEWMERTSVAEIERLCATGALCPLRVEDAMPFAHTLCKHYSIEWACDDADLALVF